MNCGYLRKRRCRHRHRGGRTAKILPRRPGRPPDRSDSRARIINRIAELKFKDFEAAEQLGSKRPLLEEQFATRGAELFVERLREIINLSRNGQIEMADMIRAYLERVERDAKGVPIKLYPFMRSQPLREQPRTVVIDPRVSFGRPVVAGTGIPTAVLAEQFKAGDPVPALAKEYGASEEAVWDAIRCELDLKAA